MQRQIRLFTFVPFATLFLVLRIAAIVHADTPTVASFTATPSTISNAYSIALAWTIYNAQGHDLYFNCPQGVTIKTTSGSAFPCNTRMAASSNASDSLGFTIINVSGATKTLIMTVYPKSGGVDYDAGAATASVTVSTAAQPISDASVSTSSPASGVPFTISWVGVDIGGANIQYACTDNLRLYAGDPRTTQPLPCNTPAYTSDQPRTGSVSVTGVNATLFPISMVARIFPAIAPGSYDSTHAFTISASVGGKIIPPDPAVTGLTAVSSVVSNIPFTLSWAAQNTTTTNLQYMCNDALALSIVVGTTTTVLPCGTPAFSTPLPGTGSTTLSVSNKTGYSQNLNLTLMPQSGSNYLLNTARSLFITVLPPGSSQPTPIQTPVANAPVTIATSSAPTHIVFTLALSRGSQNAEVKALQQFLALNPAIYPEAAVTSYYGPATERAVRRFQEKYALAKKGDAGYGNVGPKTRAKLNALQAP